MAKDISDTTSGSTGRLVAPPKGAVRTKILEEMRRNPKGDWTVSDVEKACNQIGLKCNPPSRGSHYKVSSKHCSGILTIPARKPIKPVYIKNFIGLADAHLKKAGEE